MHLIVIAIIIGTVSRDAVCHDEVDLIEINHLHDVRLRQDGTIAGNRESFRQTIFWNWSPSHARFLVVDWRKTCVTGRPIPDARGGWLLIWMDGDRWRCVRAKSFRETWHLRDFDPEIENRKVFPMEFRKKLLR